MSEGNLGRELARHEERVAGAPDGAAATAAAGDLLAFLEADPEARALLKLVRTEWNELVSRKGRELQALRGQVYVLEARLRSLAEELGREVGSPEGASAEVRRRLGALEAIREPDWYQEAAGARSDLDPQLLEAQERVRARTERMIAAAAGRARRLAELAEAAGLEVERAEVMEAQASELMERYEALQGEMRAAWERSPVRAMEQMELALRIHSGELLPRLRYLSDLELRSLGDWRGLIRERLGEGRDQDVMRIFENLAGPELEWGDILRGHALVLLAELRALAGSA